MKKRNGKVTGRILGRFQAALVLGLMLSGCVANLPDLATVGTAVANGPRAPAKMSVLDGSVIVAGPPGFCVDTSTSHDDGTGAFVLMGSCASISRSLIATRPKTPAILTATISRSAPDGPPLVASFPELAKFLASDAGRAALSRSGNAKTVAIALVTAIDDVMYVRASDSAAAQGREVDPEYWRALFQVNGQIVTVTVLGLTEYPIDADAKRALLDQMVTKIKASSSKA